MSRSDNLFNLAARFEQEMAAAPFDAVAKKRERPGEEGQHIPDGKQPEPFGQQTVLDEFTAEQ